MNNHISEQLWGEGVEGSCSRCHTLKLAHYQYAKNDPDLMRTSQISLSSIEIPVQIAGEATIGVFFFKSLHRVSGDTPSHSHPPLGGFAPSSTPCFKVLVLSDSLYFHPCTARSIRFKLKY